MSGRRDELTALRRGLLGSQRLMTLTGPGGIGKTWLARRAVNDLGPAFSDGAYVVELGDLAEVDLLAPTVAASLGLRPRARHVDVSVLVPLVGDRHMLVVLDRCEHLLPDCARFVAELLRCCPRLHILVTSRQTLGVTGEHVVAPVPLSVPAQASEVDPATAMSHAGVALFVERATKVLPDFRLGEANVAAVCAVCRRLDGNPLAIELAAGRAGLLAPQAILERLDDRYRLLTRARGDTSPPLRSLRASVETSWELCTEAERTLWARLAVFPADFDLDAVEEVCSGDGIEESQILDLVDSLLDKSLLVREAHPTSVRYRMSETLRAYGAERLGADAVRRWSDRYLRWTEGLVLEAERELFGPRQTSQLHRLRREHRNIAATLEKVTEDPAWSPRAVRMIQALEPWWIIGGRICEARLWLATVRHRGVDVPEDRAHALALAAWLGILQGDLEEAEELLEEAAPIPAEGSSESLHLIARAQGCLLLARGDVEAAARLLERSVELATRTGRDAAVAEAWLLVALSYVVADRGDDARTALRRCLSITNRAGDRQVRASALALQAVDALRRGEVATASASARMALRAKVEVEDGFAVVFILEVLAWAALVEADPVRTAVLVGAAERMWRTEGLTPASMGPLAAGREERLTAARDALGGAGFDRHVARGAALTPEAVIRYAEDDSLPPPRYAATSAPLTTREMGVAELVAQGMSNREIAAALVISVRTVQGHVEHILRKLEFGSRAQVAAWVAQRGVDVSP